MLGPSSTKKFRQMWPGPCRSEEEGSLMGQEVTEEESRNGKEPTCLALCSWCVAVLLGENFAN